MSVGHVSKETGFYYGHVLYDGSGLSPAQRSGEPSAQALPVFYRQFYNTKRGITKPSLPQMSALT